MSLRTAFRQNKLLLAAILLFAGWTVLAALNVVASMGPVSTGNWIGQHGVGGLFGLAALGLILAFALTVYSELGESQPAPTEWPPE